MTAKAKPDRSENIKIVQVEARIRSRPVVLTTAIAEQMVQEAAYIGLASMPMS
ncbi:MAG TPA: hypothetical protein VK436_09355 [Methanocella sp.]|nr:hypothetical protein [Methanocella sp.]